MESIYSIPQMAPLFIYSKYVNVKTVVRKLNKYLCYISEHNVLNKCNMRLFGKAL